MRCPRSIRLGHQIGWAGAAVAVGLAGCAGSPPTAWTWTQPVPYTGPAEAGQEPARASVDPGVAVFARSGFIAADRPEAARRDSQIAARGSEALPDRLAWPRAARPDLSRTRTVRSSRTAERWVYPERRRDPVGRPHHHHHGHYPPYRGW